jgi:hypothetical protein
MHRKQLPAQQDRLFSCWSRMAMLSAWGKSAEIGQKEESGISYFRYCCQQSGDSH